MSTTIVNHPSGDVRVTNLPTVTRYYRGRYYRTTRTVATTATGFRMISQDTFFGHPTALAWFWTEEGSDRALHFTRFDDSHVTEQAPF